jgi:hypothetical protein
MGIWYCSREDVKSALDTKETARNNRQVDRAIESASVTINGLCHRKFYPELRTMTWDWPNAQRARSWRLWLDANELISITTMTSGGVVIPEPDRFLYPADGPPFTRLELDLDSSAAFSAGDTHQRSVSILGLFGYNADEVHAGALADAVNDSATTMDVTDSAAIGVGHILRVGAERMVCTGKSMLTTGQTLQAPVDAQAKTVLIPVTNGAAFAVDEVVLLDAERMLIVDIAGNNLIVKRAWDGSVLASHTGATIFALRRLVVERGALGTTAASHLAAAPIARHLVPGPINTLAIAEALTTVQQEGSGYARIVGSGDKNFNSSNARLAAGVGLEDLRSAAYTACGRKARSRAV